MNHALSLQETQRNLFHQILDSTVVHSRFPVHKIWAHTALDNHREVAHQQLSFDSTPPSKIYGVNAKRALTFCIVKYAERFVVLFLQTIQMEKNQNLVDQKIRENLAAEFSRVVPKHSHLESIRISLWTFLLSSNLIVLRCDSKINAVGTESNGSRRSAAFRQLVQTRFCLWRMAHITQKKELRWMKP